MREYKLRLLSEESLDLVELQLHPATSHQPLADLIKIPSVKVFSSRPYHAQLLTANTSEIRSLEILINGYPAPHTFHANTGNIMFHLPGNGERIFADSFGLSHIILEFKTTEGSVRLKSEYFQVMVRPDDENFSVNSMGCYAARNNRLLLYGTQKDYIRFEPHYAQEQYSMEDKIRLFKQTGILLENAWQSIRLNPRTQSEDIFKEHRCLDAKCLQKLNRHPEHLIPVSIASGVRIGHRSYVPDFGRFSNTGKSTDVYENQVILSFIQTIIKETSNMIPKIEAYKKQLPVRFDTSGIFVTSSTYMARATQLTLEDMIKDLQQIKAEFCRLYERYQSIIPASEFELTSPPKSSAAFRQLPGYRQVFGSIGQWFAMRNVSAGDIRFATTFLQITTLYEVYVLSKLGRFFLDWGFELVSAKMVSPERREETFYEPPSINNIFVYKRDSLKVTLFYQPVIYGQKSARQSSCNLIRNTSLSFPRGWGEPTSGRYYTPDYVFKLESELWQGAKYILGDAKYATYRNVRDYKVIPLAYKYLFSISPSDPQDEITGLYIFHGKKAQMYDPAAIAASVYDLVQSGHEIFPQVEIIGLSESIRTDEAGQFAALRKLFLLQFEHAAGRPLFEAATETEAKQPLESENPLQKEKLMQFETEGNQKTSQAAQKIVFVGEDDEEQARFSKAQENEAQQTLASKTANPSFSSRRFTADADFETMPESQMTNLETADLELPAEESDQIFIQPEMDETGFLHQILAQPKDEMLPFQSTDHLKNSIPDLDESAAADLESSFDFSENL